MNSVSKQVFAFILLLVVGISVFAGVRLGQTQVPFSEQFSGKNAYQYLKQQLEMGPRTPNSTAHTRLGPWAVQIFKENGWRADLQEGIIEGHPVRNIVAERQGQAGSNAGWIVLGAHYDSRLLANQDANPQLRTQPVPGANDGASGVAVLLELSRVLPPDLPQRVTLVLFDLEDQGDIAGWNWILGSTYFASQLSDTPNAVVVIDMIGDADLNLHYEMSSNRELSKQIWDTALQAGYTSFKPLPKYSMLDDHTPFLRKNIPAVDIIDFDYPAWHTTSDTLEKVSASSLEVVGQTLLLWLTLAR